MLKLTPDQKLEVIKTIRQECLTQGVTINAQIAYVLATTEWETAKSYLPVVESYWLPNPDEYNKLHHSEYYPYYGRGYVQLTWKKNYALFSKLLNKDLVAHPDLALTPNIARYILVHGMKEGLFTGKKLQDYLPKDEETKESIEVNFKEARRIINGVDKKCDIALLAGNHFNNLSKGVYG